MCVGRQPPCSLGKVAAEAASQSKSACPSLDCCPMRKHPPETPLYRRVPAQMDTEFQDSSFLPFVEIHFSLFIRLINLQDGNLLHNQRRHTSFHQWPGTIDSYPYPGRQSRYRVSNSHQRVRRQPLINRDHRRNRARPRR